ncbi:MAG TPA: tetratricopeptide repeat protein, partial [Bryobacteraceae bacterium]|nr:tetratricopeptide repeat protein [Bryobacteraceae bacterium]
KPGYPEALNARGFAWLLLRKYPRAIADFDAALRLRPDYPNAAHNRKVAVAAASGTSPIQAQSSPAESLWRAARELIQSGQYHDAVKKLDTAIDLKPKYAQAFNARGFAWLLLRQYERALGDFDRALQILPDYPNALHNRQATLKAAAAAILHAGK